jgi:hypothetical protein
MTARNYMIGTGWWCADAEPPTPGRRYIGSDVIRSAEFHHLWSAAVDHYTQPQAVFIVDSASKQKPPIANPSYRMMSLLRNPGHAQVHTGHYGGWMASVIHSLEYALSNDVDYLVYVEQDALLYGEGIIEHCISRMRKPLMFGSGEGTPQPIQQSFFIVRNDGMRAFLAGLHSVRKQDKIICPEWKFVLASLPWSGRPLEFLLASERYRSLLHRCMGSIFQSTGFDLLPVGFGRSRPIDFTAEHFYFQHGDVAEVREYARRAAPAILSSVRKHAPALADFLLQQPVEAEPHAYDSEQLAGAATGARR